MGQGLRIWDENGINLVDTDYRMTQIIGSVYTADMLAGDAYMNGNIHVPEFATMTGTPFMVNIPTDHIFDTKQAQSGNGSTVHHLKEFTRRTRLEGNNIKWEYEPPLVHGNSKGFFYYYASWIIWGVY